MAATTLADLIAEFGANRLIDVPPDAVAAILSETVQVETPTTAPGSEGSVGQIRIKETPQGDIVLATSRKIPNIRLNLRKALVDGIPKTASIWSALDHPFVIPFLVLSFLGFLQDLKTITISESDAKVAMEVFRLSQGRRTV